MYYSSLAVQNQAYEEYRRQKAQDKQWDYDFKPLYVVSFMNCKNWTFEGAPQRVNEYITTYRYVDVETGIELGDGTTLVFIDIERFRKTIDDCISLEDLWIYSIKNMANQNECPEKVVGTDVESLFNMAELAKMKPDERIAYQMSMIHRIDYLNSRQEAIEEATKEGHEIGFRLGLEKGHEEGLKKGHEEGHNKGLEQGLEKGLEQGFNHAIIQMAKSGLSIKDIASIMNQPEEKIADILSDK